MSEPLPHDAQDASPWQAFFARYFALLKTLDDARSGGPQREEAAAE